MDGSEHEEAKDTRSSPSRGDATRQQIKLAARRLFAVRGLDAVSIREIVRAAGQKNAGSVNYYFASKDALIRELIRDVAALLEGERNRLVDELEASGRPIALREVVEILIHAPNPDAWHASGDEHALRFLNMLMINHRDLLFDALGGGADRGTRRCLAHLRRLIPHLPAALVRRRLMLLMLYLFAVFSSREASREQPGVWSTLWDHPAAHDNLIDTIIGMLCAAPSDETLSRLETPAHGVEKPRRRRRGETVRGPGDP